MSPGQAARRRSDAKSKRVVRRRLLVESLEDRVVLSHFRYGTIDWTPVAGGPNTIQFHLTQSWRQSYPGGSPRRSEAMSSRVPSSSATGPPRNIDLTVKSINTTDDYLVGEATFTHLTDHGRCRDRQIPRVHGEQQPASRPSRTI